MTDKPPYDLKVEHVTGARGDLYDGKGNLVAKDVEIAPYVKVELTLPTTDASRWEDDRAFLTWLETRAHTPGFEATRAQVERFFKLAGIDPTPYIIGDLVPLDAARIEHAMKEALRRCVPFHDLDPGIRELVRWLVHEGFHTTDSGDGSSKPQERRVFDFPHVVIRCEPATLLDTAHRLRDLLASRAVDIGPQGPEGTTPALEASYDVGAGVATILLSGVTDATAGLDRHWTGSRCGIESDLHTGDYVLGDTEPCALCEHDDCVASVVPLRDEFGSLKGHRWGKAGDCGCESCRERASYE